MPGVPHDEMLEDLRVLVEVESPSSDPAALAACASRVADLLRRRAGGDPQVGEDGRVTWREEGDGGRPVLLLGHLDTVWPLGSLQRLPFTVHGDGRVTGPGTFDMKAGLVVATHALARLREARRRTPVRVLFTADEEIGSPRSREAVEAEARRCGRVLVLEPCGPGGAVKVARKGVAVARITARGRASHAGLAPEEGINAAVALGGLLGRIADLSDPAAGTSVTPTLVSAGSAVNTVPAHAEAQADVRFSDPAEVDRVRAGLKALSAGQAEVEVELAVNRPALLPASSRPLLPALRGAAAEVGVEVETVSVGGGSDGNLAAAAGAAVLDGLGPDGGGAHADDEHVLVGDLERRVELLAALIPRVAEVDAGPR